MVTLESLRWVLTVAFVATSGFHLVRCLRVATGEKMVSEALHMVMGVAMVAMIWPWGGVVPAPAWIAVFTVSTGWFVTRALGATGRRIVPAFFATSMAAMVWMGASMPAQASDGMAAMPGMSTGGSLGPAAWVSGVLGGYLVLAAFGWFFRGLRLGGLATGGLRPLSWSALCHGLMSIGMGLALLAMA